MHIRAQLPGLSCTQQGKGCNCSLLMQVINLHLPSGCCKLLQSLHLGKTRASLWDVLVSALIINQAQPRWAFLLGRGCCQSLGCTKAEETLKFAAAGFEKAASLAQLLRAQERGSLLNRVLSEGKCGITARPSSTQSCSSSRRCCTCSCSHQSWAFLGNEKFQYLWR